MKPMAIDLFCGAGGMSEGILQAGFHIIFSNEISKDASETYRKRHEQLGLEQGKNTWLEVADIKNITGTYIKKKISELKDFKENKSIEIDAIFGGPPCQGFSRAGKQEVNDIRNLLFKEYLRVVSEIKPKYLVFENVPGIVDIKFKNFISDFNNESYKNKNAIDIIRNELKKIGYNLLEPRILNASNYGVPQNRHRLILIGFRNDMKEPKYPKEFKQKVTLREALSDLTNYELDNKKYQNSSKKGRTKNIVTNKTILEKKKYNNDLSKHYNYIEERFSLLNEGESNSQLRKRLIKNGLEITKYPNLLEYLSNRLIISKLEIVKKCKNLSKENKLLDLIVTKKNSRIKLYLDKPSNTVLTLPDDLILPICNRICSVREFARLQSFDDSFVFYGKRTTGGKARKNEVPQYTQVGNAVPPLLAKAIALEIYKVLKKE
ncbi:DNA cytosine methyltransferase [Fusobacterium canifelinum]|uniref:Cytosine-specific methyltransferase n=1 Tax=Fusobacterium canifelinum TaxID=285729 RepID=A0A7T4FM80_9FUSO|nr:DNA cytosine methyltransferase [Fusobacterium canifelinum]QQB73082.1 DNA cytosine methyltransferase [Fusobacterium canifelinum]